MCTTTIALIVLPVFELIVLHHRILRCFFGGAPLNGRRLRRTLGHKYQQSVRRPVYKTALPVATNVKDGIKTSCEEFTPATTNEMQSGCSRAFRYRVITTRIFFILFSNFLISGPTEETKPVLKQKETDRSSSEFKSGMCNSWTPGPVTSWVASQYMYQFLVGNHQMM